MFCIKANCNEEIEIKIGPAHAYDFFSETGNFVSLLPNLESITPERDGSLRWTLRAEVPMIGVLRVPFRVLRGDFPPQRIEYVPAPVERQNYLRCVASFSELGPQLTRVKIAQALEVRRNDAKQFHIMAAAVGPTRISAETQRQMALRLREFLQAARSQLER